MQAAHGPSPGSAMGPWPLAEESSFLNVLSYICRTTISEQVRRGLLQLIGARVWVVGLEMDMDEQSVETTKTVLYGEPTAWHGAAVGISCCLPCPTCRNSTCNKHGAGISLREICGLNIYWEPGVWVMTAAGDYAGGTWKAALTKMCGQRKGCRVLLPPRCSAFILFAVPKG